MPAPEKTPHEQLFTPVQFLKGVGPQRAEALERLGIKTLRDVLFFFPRTYEDMTDERYVDDLEEGKLQSVRGQIEDIDLRGTSQRRLRPRRAGPLTHAATSAPCGSTSPSSATASPSANMSSSPASRGASGMIWEIAIRRWKPSAEDEDEPVGKILPVYPLTEGLQQWQMRKIVRDALAAYVELLEEVFPGGYLEGARPLAAPPGAAGDSFSQRPRGPRPARRRLVYQELFILQLALAVRRRRQHEQRQAPPLEATAQIDARIRRLFPFELTAGAAAGDRGDRRRHGAAVADEPAFAGRRGERQDGGGLVRDAAGRGPSLPGGAHGADGGARPATRPDAGKACWPASQVRRAALTGGMAAKQRAALLEQIAAGEIDLVVGTQAIIQEDVRFARLGLVVIDEQHKFGVRQRAVLKQAGPDPHYLVMTATPIPRTVDDDALRRPRRFDAAGKPAGPAEGAYLLAGEDRRAALVGVLSQETPRGAPGLRRHAAG